MLAVLLFPLTLIQWTQLNSKFEYKSFFLLRVVFQLCNSIFALVCRHAVRAYADALDDTPMALAENSGLDPIEAVSKIRAEQIRTGNPRLGIDAVDSGTNGMSNFVLES